MLDRRYFKNMTVVEQGEANEWAIMDGNRWVAAFQMNGEFMPKRQKEYARMFAISRAAYYALDVAERALVKAYGNPSVPPASLEDSQGSQAIVEVRKVLAEAAELPIAKPADLAAPAKAVGGGAYPLPIDIARDLAVSIVDGVRGYTMEFSIHPPAHADDYDMAEGMIKTAIDRLEGMLEDAAIGMVKQLEACEEYRKRIADLETERDQLSVIVASGIDEVAGAALDDKEETIAQLRRLATEFETCKRCGAVKEKEVP